MTKSELQPGSLLFDKNSNLLKAAVLSGGHMSTIRAFDWSANGMFTAGEDSRICWWSPNELFVTTASSFPGKVCYLSGYASF